MRIHVDDEIDAEQEVEERKWYEFRWCAALFGVVLLAVSVVGLLVVIGSKG